MPQPPSARYRSVRTGLLPYPPGHKSRRPETNRNGRCSVAAEPARAGRKPVQSFGSSEIANDGGCNRTTPCGFGALAGPEGLGAICAGEPRRQPGPRPAHRQRRSGRSTPGVFEKPRDLSDEARPWDQQSRAVLRCRSGRRQTSDEAGGARFSPAPSRSPSRSIVSSTVSMPWVGGRRRTGCAPPLGSRGRHRLGNPAHIGIGNSRFARRCAGEP